MQRISGKTHIWSVLFCDLFSFMSDAEIVHASRMKGQTSMLVCWVLHAVCCTLHHFAAYVLDASHKMGRNLGLVFLLSIGYEISIFLVMTREQRVQVRCRLWFFWVWYSTTTSLSFDIERRNLNTNFKVNQPYRSFVTPPFPRNNPLWNDIYQLYAPTPFC